MPSTRDPALTDATWSAATPSTQEMVLNSAILDGPRTILPRVFPLGAIPFGAIRLAAMNNLVSALLVAVLCSLAAAQEPPTAENEKFPLREVLIEGNKNFATDDIIDILGLGIGDMVNRADFETAVGKLDLTGVFEGYAFRFGPKGDGYTVTFTVQEVPELYPLRLEGFDIPDEELHARLREKIPLFGPKVPPTGIMARRIGDLLQQIWIEQGHQTKIVGDINYLSDGKFEMLYQPEGVVQNIAFTRFENASAIPPLTLQQKFNSVAMGVTYSEQRLEELLKFNVKPLYEKVGHLEVKFCPCSVEPDTETKGLVVTIQVDEGPEYKFGEISPPHSSFIKPEDLQKLIKFQPGDTANLTLVSEALKRYEDQFKGNGFMKVRSQFDPTLNTENKTVGIVMRVDPGERYVFGKLVIEGLDLIAEAAIRKRWAMKTGDEFNQHYPAIFLNRVRSEQMFDNLQNTDWQMTTDEVEKAVDVQLIFK